MNNEGSTSLSFPMKEGIWLDRGKKLDELLTLSLEPVIDVDEKEDEVTVKGVLQLFGEYRPLEKEESTGNQASSLVDQSAFRSVEEVSLSEEGIGEIRHEFPIEVTIPRERVARLEDISVEINEFDYVMPEKGFLEITADLSISGVRAEEPVSTSDDAEESTEKELAREDRSFTFEQVRKVDEKEPDQLFGVSESSEGSEEEDSSEEEESQENELTFQEPVTEIKREPSWLDEKELVGTIDVEEEEDHAPKVSFRSVLDEEETIEVREEPEASHDNDYQKEVVKAPRRFPKNETRKLEDEEKSTESNVKDEEEREHENALYLTKMMANEAEAYSKLRMCIVQDGESLDMIADRYKLQVSHLMRTNRLDEEQVSEGQILYIPSRQSSSTS
ncbi:stage VI sporulation protein D [Salipaludibacillus neizhouensis]|uniref:Stage VI sporulation protein D n=1 Tax=Salipaludibacillus neizhouensis TaxID=885475 RepID=A0A3A9JZP5_9BACI|nr:stage VI sporulation protein D [Salipaludibacillus neizhouensis]RKL65947.1 stage VI sporulation protein D [Salipaludibacillus neizhouensis]